MKLRIDLRAVRRRIAHNFLWKAASTAFAIGLWAFVNLGAREAEKGIFVPLDLRNLPPNLAITSPVPETISVLLRGPRTILGSIDDRPQRIPLDLSNVRPGTTSFKIDGDMLTLPRGVRVSRVSPVQVTLDVDRVVRRTVPVSVNLPLATPPGFEVVDGEVLPPTATVTGPAGALEHLKTVQAPGLRLAAAPGPFEASVSVESPGELVQVVPDEVTVRGRLAEIVGDQRHRDVTIGARNSRGAYRVRPPAADVVVRGPERLLRNFKPSAENLYVDLSGLEKGSRTEKVLVALPEGLEVVELKPAEVSATVTPETEGKGP